jgi:hypothetical protein
MLEPIKNSNLDLENVEPLISLSRDYYYKKSQPSTLSALNSTGMFNATSSISAKVGTREGGGLWGVGSRLRDDIPRNPETETPEEFERKGAHGKALLKHGTKLEGDYFVVKVPLRDKD